MAMVTIVAALEHEEMSPALTVAQDAPSGGPRIVRVAFSRWAAMPLYDVIGQCPRSLKKGA
jgi:hypothetical protein